MSDLDAPDRPNPDPDAVRAAAGALKEALDRHLAAVEARSGEQDPAVQEAYDELQQAAEEYDELLFEVHEEVTPFEFGPDVAPHPSAILDEARPVISLYLRRDYAITDPEVLTAAGRAAAPEPALDGEEAPGEPANLGGALYELMHAEGVDGLDEAAQDVGLEPLGGTVWFLAGAEAAFDPEAGPFDDVDPDRLIYRVDEVVSEE
jgi:hypothetical protein